MPSDSPHNPPFRADHVGSLLRPPELLKARGDRASGKISAEELRAVEDSSIRAAVALQEEVGLQSITDGEYRREIFYSDFYFRGLGGGTVAYDPSSIDEVYFIDREGHKLPLLVPRVQARMRWHGPVHVDDFKFLRAATSRMPKITIPSPTIIHFRAGRQNISKDAYADIDLFWDDIVDAFHNELKVLADAGCRYVQIDETTLASLSDRRIWEPLRKRGDEARTLLLDTYPNVMNRAFAGRLPACISRCTFAAVTIRVIGAPRTATTWWLIRCSTGSTSTLIFLNTTRPAQEASNRCGWYRKTKPWSSDWCRANFPKSNRKICSNAESTRPRNLSSSISSRSARNAVLPAPRPAIESQPPTSARSSSWWSK
jgi:methionine synthase II (cobalamin-independent)